MRKIIFSSLFFLTFFNTVTAQKDILIPDKQYFRCENKWVAIPPKEGDTDYIYGFVYLDRQAGFTFDLDGHFNIAENGKFNITPHERESNIKYRLEPNTRLFAIIQPEQLKEMNLPAEPEWLSIYRKDEDETDQQVRRGFIYNDVGASDLAVPILLEAYKKEPHFESLEFELAFAYNALEQPEKAIQILESALKNDPENSLFYRELGYSYKHLKNTDKAESTYIKGISISKDAVEKAEMAFNMAGLYYESKNKKKFDEWAAIVKKYAEKDSVYLQELNKLETLLK